MYARTIVVLCVGSLICVTSLHAETDISDFTYGPHHTNSILGSNVDEKPPLDERVAYELLAGTALGFVGFATGVGGYVALGSPGPDAAGATFLILSAVFGSVIGNTIGVYSAGHIGNQTGSFTATLVGSAIGVWAFWIGAPIGATIAFNMTRRYETSPTSEEAFLDIHDGEVRVGMPPVTGRHSSTDRGALMKVEVVKVRF
jgi:hypothetical protein